MMFHSIVGSNARPTQPRLGVDRIDRPSRRAFRAVLFVGTISVLLIVSIGVTSVTPGTPAHLPAGTLLNQPKGSRASIPQHHLVSVPLSSAGSGFSYIDSPPAWLAYDSADQSLYVAVPPSSVDIAPFISGSSSQTPEINATIPVGTDPFGVAFDSVTGAIFVTNTGSNNVSVLNGNLPTPVAAIPVGSNPTGVAFDPSNGNIYVANNGSNSVSVISGASLTVTATVNVGSEPLGVAADPTTGNVFVANYGSSTVSVISGAENQVVATANVGSEPYGVAVDTSTGDVYVTNQGSSNISVLSASSGALRATIAIAIGSPLQGIAYDSGDGYMWVGAGRFYTVVVDPANESVLAFVDFDPTGVTYDPNNGDVCVTNSLNRTLECVLFPDGAYYTSPVTFSESGLPHGSSWTVIVNGGVPEVTSNGTELAFYSPYAVVFNTTSFTVLPSGAFFPGPLEGNTSSGYTVAFSTRPGFYPVTFAESGLPAGTLWSVNLGESSHSSTIPVITLGLSNGTYSYLLQYESGFAPMPLNGSISIDGGGLTIPVSYVPTYPVVFTETGLPAGTNWSVTLTGTTPSIIQGAPFSSTTVLLTLWSDGAPNILFIASDGEYSFAAVAPGYSTEAGSLTILRHAPDTEALSFVPVTSPWSVFPESGSATPYYLIGATVGLIVVIGATVALIRRRRRIPPGSMSVQPPPVQGVPSPSELPPNDPGYVPE